MQQIEINGDTYHIGDRINAAWTTNQGWDQEMEDAEIISIEDGFGPMPTLINVEGRRHGIPAEGDNLLHIEKVA